MYGLGGFHDMMADPVRIEPYRRAIQATVEPGDVVIDLGAGLCLMAFMALEAGASHVIAIEPNRLLDVGRKIATDNGFADRMTFVQADSRQYTPKAPVDVIVSDIRGKLPVVADNFVVLADARDRLMKPGGRFVPSLDELYLCPVEYSDAKNRIGRWMDPLWGFDFSGVAPLVSERWDGVTAIPADAPICESQRVATLDYHTGVINKEWLLEASFEVGSERTFTGLLVWVQSQLWDDVWIRHRPGRPASVYGHAYFPLRGAYAVEPGDRMECRITSVEMNGQLLWSWNAAGFRGGRELFRESLSTLRDVLGATAGFYAPDTSELPGLGEYGHIAQHVFAAMSERRPVADVAREIVEAYPNTVPSLDDAVNLVREFVRQFGAGQ